MKKTERFSQSITAKALIIAALILLLLIPKAMISDLIRERKMRSIETIEKINAKWSLAQTLCGPVLNIPYTQTRTDKDNKLTVTEHELTLAPEQLDISVELFPEERHYGIYKTILYKSRINMKGAFPETIISPEAGIRYHWEKAYATIGLSDLRGVTENINFKTDSKTYMAEAGGINDQTFGKKLNISLQEGSTLSEGKPLAFNCNISLNGSSDINFIPIARTTKVEISGKWNAPGFIGNFSPEYELDNEGFTASWSVLHFNRNIPDYWTDSQSISVSDYSFGVSLVDTVDHYQQNTRSAKYALMFIVLTFTLFFFVEVLTGKKIHPIQYLLVGAALILFYSLLLSISEQINFGLAYLTASIATISLITAYAHSIFKNKTHTALLAGLLGVLYTFLYVVLQLEDVALLIGSIGLFGILGIIMYASRKINWYKQEE